MQAAVLKKWRDPEEFEVIDIEKPQAKDGEVLIKVMATSVTAGDCEIRKLKLPLGLSLPIRIYGGWKRPTRLKILGQEFAGIVKQVGSGDTHFKVGDEVFGTTGFKFGAYSQYICCPVEHTDLGGVIAEKPHKLKFEEAAVIPTAGMEAFHYINKSSLTPGQRVLIIGAGGSIGTLVIQLAKSRGLNVTVLDSEEKLSMLHNLKADEVLDYRDKTNWMCNNKFDLIIDVVGKNTVLKGLKLLKRGGYYYLAYAKIAHLLLGILTHIFLNKRLTVEAATQTEAELKMVANGVEKELIRPIIDKVFTLDEITEAHKYADSGKKQGNISIKINHE